MLTSKCHSLYVKEWEAESAFGGGHFGKVEARNFGKVGLESESNILPATPQPGCRDIIG